MHDGDNPPTPSEALALIVASLRHYLKSPQERPKWTDEWMVGLTVVIAIAAIVSAWIFQGQLTESRTNAQVGQRAYVSFSPTIDTFYNTKGEQSDDIKSWQFFIPIRNTGLTFAKHLRDHVTIVSTEHELPRDFDFGDFQDGERSFIAPQDHISYVTEPVPVGTLADVKSKTKHVYVYGWASYRDVFKDSETHVTKFCYELNPPAGDFMKVGGGASFHFSLWGPHNCADDECTSQNPN